MILHFKTAQKTNGGPLGHLATKHHLSNPAYIIQSVLYGNAALKPWNHTRVTNAISAAPSENGLAMERLWWGC